VTRFHVPLESVWNMTRTQVRELYFREMDEHGNPVRAPRTGTAPSRADRWRHIRRLQGWPEHKIDEAISAMGRG
jgi:hypothetical protein